MSKLDSPTSTNTTILSTDDGSNSSSNSYELKRFSEADTKGKTYLSSFYKYMKGGINEDKTVRVPECSFENYINEESAYSEIKNMTNSNNAIGIPFFNAFGNLIDINHTSETKFNKLGENFMNDKKADIKPYNYIIFAINGNEIEGFFLGNCIFNIEDLIFISNKSDEPASILHNKLDKQNKKRRNDYLLTNVETKQYLQNKNSNPNANEIFKGRWLVFRLLDNDNCKASIDASTLVSNKNSNWFGNNRFGNKWFGGSRSRKSQRKHKSKKYARKTIRKHKSRKNRN